MQDNLAELQSRGQPSFDDGGRRADLLARFNQACLGGGGNANPADPSQNRGADFFDSIGRSLRALGGAQGDPDALSTVPLDGDIMEDPQERSAAAGKAICVRTCDGGYFPLAPERQPGPASGARKPLQSLLPEYRGEALHHGQGG